MEQSSLNKQPAQDNNKYQFYTSQLKKFQNRLQDLINILKLPLSFILPPNFQQRYIESQEAQHQYRLDAQWVDKYKDIIIYQIEAQINLPIMSLAIRFRSNFGGQIQFWLQTICKFSQNQKYDESFRMWQVYDCYKTYQHLAITQYQNSRKYRKHAKIDIEVTRKLISSINQLKLILKQNPINSKKKALDDLFDKVTSYYSRHEQLHKKLQQLLKGNPPSKRNQSKNINQLQFFQQKKLIPSNLLIQQKKQCSNSKTKKQTKQNLNIFKQKVITDYSQQITQNKGILLLRKIQRQQDINNTLKQEKLLELDDLYHFMYKNQTPLQDLRLKFTQQKSKLMTKTRKFYTTTIISYSSFWYKQYEITEDIVSQFNLTQPFQQKTFVNYQNGQDQQYQELLGVDLDQSNAQEDDSQDIQTHQSSYDQQVQRWLDQEFNFQADKQDYELHEKAISIKLQFQGTPWTFNYKQPQLITFYRTNQQKRQIYIPQIQPLLNSFIAIPYQNYPMRLQELTQQQLYENASKKLLPILNGKTFLQITKIVQLNQDLKQQFPRHKLTKFLQQNTIVKGRCKDGKKTRCYFVIDHNKQKEQHSRQSINTSTKSMNKQTKNNLSISDFCSNKSKIEKSNNELQIQLDDDFQSEKKQKQQEQWQGSKRYKSQILSNPKYSQHDDKTRRTSNSRKSNIQIDQFDQNSTRSIGRDSITLRQRKNKPIYSLSLLFKKNQKLTYDKQQQKSDIQI